LRLLRFGFDVFAGDGGRERVPDDTLVGELFGFIVFNLSWRFFFSMSKAKPPLELIPISPEFIPKN
jgi:hypothetical protein